MQINSAKPRKKQNRKQLIASAERWKRMANRQQDPKKAEKCRRTAERFMRLAHKAPVESYDSQRTPESAGGNILKNPALAGWYAVGCFVGTKIYEIMSTGEKSRLPKKKNQEGVQYNGMSPLIPTPPCRENIYDPADPRSRVIKF